MRTGALRVVSLFCGCGGADLGLYAAAEALGVSVKVVDAIDNDPVAVRVYNANLPHAVARVADVKQMTRADLPPHDLVIGGPPCQDHSLAGKRACHCDKGEPAVDRCCLADFVRLATGSAWLMENVRPFLIRNAPWSEQLCAADFGDVTSRKRWFYSDHLLHVWPTPGPRRIRDIRDHAEDERILAKRGLSFTHGGVGGFSTIIVTHRPRTNSQGCAPYATIAEPDGFMASLTESTQRAYSGETLRLGLRSFSASASASAFNDCENLGSILSNSWHGNEASRLEGCRNPSLLEMARAHSIPDSFDWAGATKTQCGKMIANSWPVGMATAVCKAMLIALGVAKEAVA